ncbi:hypothetical protein, partial [Massilibacteroides sp.]|uniref:hypothetical protein n=1 Tax=Massilibacteroides sp. TaxID=2034766 RepID=UPI00261FCA20
MQSIDKNGEIPLLNEDKRIVALDSLELWQAEQAILKGTDENVYSQRCLSEIDKIPARWLDSLTEDQWKRIKKQKTLYGIPLPEDWIKTWRFILKEPRLRDAESASRGGKAIGSQTHMWNLWAEECIDKFLDEMDKDLIFLVDSGLLYAEVGDKMYSKWGEKFWKKRK